MSLDDLRLRTGHLRSTEPSFQRLADAIPIHKSRSKSLKRLGLNRQTPIFWSLSVVVEVSRVISMVFVYSSAANLLHIKSNDTDEEIHQQMSSIEGTNTNEEIHKLFPFGRTIYHRQFCRCFTSTRTISTSKFTNAYTSVERCQRQIDRCFSSS